MIKTYADIVQETYSYVYPIDGYDPITQEIDGLSPTLGRSMNTGTQKYMRKLGVKLAKFFGLPTRIYDIRYSFENFCKNMVGWHTKYSPDWQKALNYTFIKPLLFAVLNLAAIPFNFALNVLRFFTEFLPLLGIGLTTRAIEMLKHGLPKDKDSLSYQVTMGLIHLLTGVRFFLHCLLFVLQPITSPCKAMRAALKIGQDIGGWGGNVISGVLAVLSGLISFASVVLFFKFAVPKLALLFMTNLPSLATSTQAIWGSINIPQFTSLCTTVGQSINTVLQPALAFFGLAATATSPFCTGLGAFIGSVIATVGTPISIKLHQFSNWWYHLTNHNRSSLRAMTIEEKIAKEDKEEKKENEFNENFSLGTIKNMLFFGTSQPKAAGAEKPSTWTYLLDCFSCCVSDLGTHAAPTASPPAAGVMPSTVPATSPIASPVPAPTMVEESNSSSSSRASTPGLRNSSSSDD